MANLIKKLMVNLISEAMAFNLKFIIIIATIIIIIIIKLNIINIVDPVNLLTIIFIIKQVS